MKHAAKLPRSIRARIPSPQKSGMVKSRCLAALQQLQSEAAPAVGELIRTLELSWPKMNFRTDPYKGEAIACLSAIGPAAQASLPALLRVADEDARYATACATALARIGPADARVHTFLKSRMEQADPFLSVYVAELLWPLKPEPDVFLPRLGAILTNATAQDRVRHNAVALLGRIATRHPAAFPLLEQATSDPSRGTRMMAGRVLCDLNGQTNRYIGLLITGLETGEEHERWAYIIELARFVNQDDRIVPAIASQLDSDSFRLRGKAAMTLVELSRVNAAAWDAVETALAHPSQNVREVASDHLTKLNLKRIQRPQFEREPLTNPPRSRSFSN
jgi:HEAT repeat protein